MSSLFIAGNGFDIAHGIPTKYSDFRAFILERYPDAFRFRDEIIYMKDYDNIDIDEFAAEILLSTMDKVSGEEWNNFEDALAHIDFGDKFPRAKHKENETDEEDRKLMKEYMLYMAMLSSDFICCTEFWQELFQWWIKEVQMQIKHSNYAYKRNLRKLFNEPNMLFLTFNYTKTLQKLYDVKDVTHIHNYVGQKLVFGHGQDDATYEESSDKVNFGSSFLDDMVMTFRKDTITQQIKYKSFFKKLNYNIDKVYSYGFSYAKVDSVYIKRIINCISPEATWYFTTFEAKDSEALRIKKVKLRNYGFKGSFGIYEG